MAGRKESPQWGIFPCGAQFFLTAKSLTIVANGCHIRAGSLTIVHVGTTHFSLPGNFIAHFRRMGEVCGHDRVEHQ
jgi:hypothetical protein